MIRGFYVSLFFLLLAVPGALTAREVPDPFGPSTLQARALRGLRGEVASLILRADPGGELAMETLAVPLLEPSTDEEAASAAKQRVAVLVEIDGTSFLELNQSDVARLEVYLYALSEQGFAIADYRAEVVAVDIATLGEIVWQSGIKYYGELSLPPGRYRLRTLVRNYQSKVAGLRETALIVPEPSTSDRALTPLFPDPTHREPWLPIRAWRDDLITGLLDEPLEGLKSQASRPYPFSIGEMAIRPATRPVLVPNRSTTLYIHGRLPATVQPSLQWIAPDSEAEKVVATVPLEIHDRVDQDSAGSSFFEARFVTPAELSPGPWLLRVLFKIGDSNIVSPPILGHLMGSGVREQNLLWSDLRWRESGPSNAANNRVEQTPQGRNRSGRKAGKLSQEYRQILASMNETGSSSTMSRLLDFETQVLNEGSRKASSLLQIAEFQVAEALAEVDPESLVPLIQLHQNLYLAYRGRRLFSLGTHSRVFMERVAELYAEKGSSQGSRIVAARALTSLGGYLQAGGLAATSQRLFRRSLELDPSSETAMLALACGYERLGSYGRAKEVLEKLVTTHPKMSEGWMRLAMSTGRLGNRLRSREQLEKVITLGGPAWLRDLAHEELARIHLVLDQVQESLELLEKISDPSAGTLVMTAYLYDRLGSSEQAFKILERIETKPTSGPSPRKRYDGWPEKALGETRTDLQTAAGIRLSRLKDLVSKETS